MGVKETNGLLLATGAANRVSLTTGIAATTGAATEVAGKTLEGANEEEDEDVGKMSDGAESSAFAKVGSNRNVGSRLAGGEAASIGDDDISAESGGESSGAEKFDDDLVFLAELLEEEMPAVLSRELGPVDTREAFRLLEIRNAADIVGLI